MHYLIRVVVEAEDVKEASRNAWCVMDNLLEWREFDWYTERAEDSRWERCWQPVKLSSKDGQAWVKDAMHSQLAEFKESILAIREMLEKYSDEQIFNEEFDTKTSTRYLSRYQFGRASGYHANTCQLFDTEGSAITNQRELDYLLEKPENLWVVQVDAHN